MRGETGGLFAKVLAGTSKGNNWGNCRPYYWYHNYHIRFFQNDFRHFMYCIGILYRQECRKKDDILNLLDKILPPGNR